MEYDLDMFDGVDEYHTSVAAIASEKKRIERLENNPLVKLCQNDRVIEFTSKVKNDDMSAFMVISRDDQIWLRRLVETFIRIYKGGCFRGYNKVCRGKASARTIEYKPQSWIKFLEGFYTKLSTVNEEMTVKQSVRLVDFLEILRSNVPAMAEMKYVEFKEIGIV